MIQYYNRVSKQQEVEKVYGNAYLEWAYQNPIGIFLTKNFFSKPWLSKLMGAYEDSSMSISKIAPFIEQYKIPMNDFEEASYSNFNEFFIRKFKPGKRPFSTDPKIFCAGAEARYLAFENLSLTQEFKVKGFQVSLPELLADEALAEEFVGGSFILARLCPVDYHRFHFPCDGELISYKKVRGELHSVNPAAFKAVPDVFFRNERDVSIFNTPEFGKVAMIEVGALGVGKIIQSHPLFKDPAAPSSTHKFDKGQEKGYFLFGGSTVIWLVKKEQMNLSADLLQNSARGLETLIPLGDRLT